MAGNKKRLVFLSYAVNGAGVGHVVRQIAIQQWLRRLCAFAGVSSEHWFITTSEADSLVFQAGFAAFKLPSKSIVEPAGIDKLGYIAMARVWVNNSIALLRPDVLLVDTFAQGSFNELPAVLDLVPTKVLVQRPLKDGYANRPAYQQLVGAYDVVVVPEHEDDVPEMRELLAVSSSRLRFVGPIVRVDPSALLTREAARASLGVPMNARCVLVTGGGGGDVGNDALFDAVAAAVGDVDDVQVPVHVVYAVGPLFRGRSRHGVRATQFSGADLAEHAAAFDVAVSAAGFNTIHELLVGGVPTIVVPQDKIADDQRQRAERYADRGAVVVVDGLAQVASTLTSLLADDAKRAALSTAAKAVLPRGHAKEAAAAALSLSVAPSVLRAAVDVVDDGLIAQLGSIGLDEIVTLALARADHDDRAALTRDDVLATLTWCRQTTASPAVLVRLLEVLRRRFRGDDDRSVQQAVVAMCTAVAADEHAALLELVLALPQERPVPAAVVAAAVVEAVHTALARGVDVMALAVAARRRAPSLQAAQTAGSATVARLRQAATEARA